jgi:hypothetical protein
MGPFTQKVREFRLKLINTLLQWRSILSAQFLNFSGVTGKR